MYCLLNITTDWIGAIGAIIAAIVGVLGIPILNKHLKKKKKQEKGDIIIEDHKRKIIVQPCLVLQNSTIQNNSITIINLRNKGLRAENINIIIPLIDRTIEKMIIDKHNLENDEAIKITLIGNLIEPVMAPLRVYLLYADIDGRRYQQEYSKYGPRESITQPELILDTLIQS
jgi:hypothetical protein